MSTRWFYSHARRGAADTTAGPLTPATAVQFTVTGTAEPITAPGPTLTLAGPADVAAIDAGLILREQPPPGTTDAPENIMASIDFAHADLPWLLSTRTVARPGTAVPQVLPWLVLVVLSRDEADPPRPADPVPILDAPPSLLPPLDQSWAWAHVEARLDDSVTSSAAATAAAADGVRRPSATVVGRLICPRKLHKDASWIAAVVAVPDTGRWPAPQAGQSTIGLPVHHWWSFHTGDSGTFEDLSRRLHKNQTAATSVGSRVVDVGRPWPDRSATAAVTILDGALRVSETDDSETWSNTAAQNDFRAALAAELNAPAARRQSSPAPDSSPPAATEAVGPPLYGSHFSGQQTVDPTTAGWMSTLNLEVRRRVAAALGARYVQVEQEFLMARAWEQAGAIREANRMLAAAELASVAATAAQTKHIKPLSDADLLTLLAPLAARAAATHGPAADGPTFAATHRGAPTLAAVLAAHRSGGTGAASTAFSRLTRPGGALARRIGRLGAATIDTAPIDITALTGTTVAIRTFSGEPAEQPFSGQTVCAALDPVPLQLLRLKDIIEAPAMAARAETDPRPLRQILAHPVFTVPIAEEILARWPDWAIPGITGLAAESITLVDTNPEFVAALLVGLNEEFNRELLWREFPTNQRGTSFARFWPTPGADIDEIASWAPDTTLGSQVKGGQAGSVVLIIRGELLRRFPGTPLLAIKGVESTLRDPATGAQSTVTVVPDDLTGALTATSLLLDESTLLYIFTGLDERTAIDEKWFFVLREPVHGTQFGYDKAVQGAPPTRSITSWNQLTWDDVTLHPNEYVNVEASPRPTTNIAAPDPALWGAHAADMARIAFQQPFQLAVRASGWLGQ